MASTCLQRRGFSNIGNFLSEKQKGLFAIFNLEKRNGFFGVLDLGKRNDFSNAGRLDNVFRNEPVPDVWIVKFETSRNDTNVSFFFLFLDSGRLDDEFRNELVPDVWIVKFETSRNAGRNFWVKDPRLRLQDEISKFIFRSPSLRKNFEGSRVPFQHFEG
ncbi:unnamed protein product [Rhizophagus irregularis]|nr:unnamed protein product [Rhizophagus irregularis]